MRLSYDWFIIYFLGSKERDGERVIIHLLPTRQNCKFWNYPTISAILCQETITWSYKVTQSPVLKRFGCAKWSPPSLQTRLRICAASLALIVLLVTLREKVISKRNIHGLTLWPEKLKSLCDEGDRKRYHVFCHLNVHLVPFATFLASPDRLKVP